MKFEVRITRPALFGPRPFAHTETFAHAVDAWRYAAERKANDAADRARGIKWVLTSLEIVPIKRQ